MTDKNINIPDSGDVLGSGTNDIKNSVDRIAQSTDNIEKEVRDSNKYILEFLKQNKDSSSANFSSKIDEDVHSSSRSRDNTRTFMSSVRNTRASKSSSSSYMDKILEGFEESLAEKLGISDFNKNYSTYIDNIKNNLARNLDIDPDDLPNAVFSAITDKASNTRLGSKLDGVFTKAANWYVGGIKNSIKKGIDTYDSEISSRFGTSPFSSDNLLKSQDDFNNEKRSPNTQEVEIPSPSDENNSDNLLKDTINTSNMNVMASNVNIATSEVNKVKSETKSDDIIEVDAKVKDVEQKLLPSASSEGSVKDTLLQKSKDSVMDSVMDSVTKGSTKGSTKAPAKQPLALPAANSTGNLGSVAGAAGKGAMTALKSAGPQLAIIAVLVGLANEINEFVGNIKEAFKHWETTADRLDASLWAGVEAQEARIKADYETMIKKPFEILEDAAQKVYDVWDSALQTITATQGYDKSGLQDLMSAYASRLRSEGLSSVVGTTDVTNMLQSILNAGLSGTVAEEFAYQATILNKAIPTEDFTSYASSYASLVSSYISLGHSQEEALEYANDQLGLFASNVLTASRQISGGLTTSLTGVSDLFENIVKISQTAGVSDTTSISSALSIVQAVAGQVSPEVGNGLVSQIVSAAVGGNDTNLVALRSLAGIGASNTAFLQALSSNPNQVLANMFQGLSNMFDKSSDNYMEVAYSLADTFGISVDAMTRVNWDQLVTELRSNSSSSSALMQNMQLLQSGETTTSSESQRLSQINEYMIDQGLSYVLDNEAARAIQEHMWDQQLASEMQEATYAVEFASGALEIVTSIVSFLTGILNVLTLGLANIGQWAQSGIDNSNIQNDIKSMLEAGKVGEGNATQLHDLTSYDVMSLQRTPSYMEYWGLSSAYRNNASLIADLATGSVTSTIIKRLESDITKNNSSSTSSTSAPTSKYTWASSGKSTLSSLDTPIAGGTLSGVSSLSASEQISQQSNAALNEWFNSMSEFVSNGQTFQEWMDSASDYGFSDASAAMEEGGYTESDLKQAYMQEGTDQAVSKEIEDRQKEREFWDAGINWWNTVYVTDRDAWNEKYDTNVINWNTLFTDKWTEWTVLYTTTMTAFQEDLTNKYTAWTTLYTDSVAVTHKKLQYSNNQFDNEFVYGFLYDWRDYYIGNHTHYREATNFSQSLRTINTEKTQTGEAVLALAETLTKNYEDLADPAVQTNVLLGQVVILLQSILTAQQSGKGLTLPTALSALGLNILSDNT